MDPLLKKLIDDLPAPKKELNEKRLRRIREYMPVPNDHVVLWADMLSFGGYPAGVVITDRAMIVKATRDEVKAQNAEAKKRGKSTGEKQPKVKTIYRMIPWEYYSPDDYEVVAVAHGRKGTRYVIKSTGEPIAQFGSSDLYRLFSEYKAGVEEQRAIADAIVENATFSAIDSLNVEGVMFNAAYGADQTKTGHGIYAEEAGAILDKIHGEQSTVVGRDNAKNGPDKIVNAAPVQCKYCKTANASVNTCFRTNPTTGLKEFRYFDLSDSPMKIEVASDQYAQAIEYMKARITEGSVKGVSDPNAAYDIIRKGRLSYAQARNLAKAGNIDSIRFDAATGAVTCLSALGISAVVTFAQVMWSTKDPKKAARYAIVAGLKVYGLSFAGGIIASQISRTGLMNAVRPMATNLSRSLSPKTVQAIINSFRALAGKKAIYGAAAQKSFAKFLGSNLVTEGIMFVVFAVPDTYKLLEGRVSGAQYTKNMASLLLSFAGAIVGTALAGRVIGRTVGSIAGPKGAAIGMGGGLVVGGIAGGATKAVGDMIHEDDGVITTRMFNAVLINVIMDYMLSEQEQSRLIEMLDADSKPLRKLQENILKTETQEKAIRQYLEPKAESIIAARKTISEEDEADLEENMTAIILDGELNDEM